MNETPIILLANIPKLMSRQCRQTSTRPSPLFCLNRIARRIPPQGSRLFLCHIYCLLRPTDKLSNRIQNAHSIISHTALPLVFSSAQSMLSRTLLNTNPDETLTPTSQSQNVAQHRLATSSDYSPTSFVRDRRVEALFHGRSGHCRFVHPSDRQFFQRRKRLQQRPEH